MYAGLRMQPAKAVLAQEDARAIRLMSQPVELPSAESVGDKQRPIPYPLLPAGLEDAMPLRIGDIDHQIAAAVTATVAVESLKHR
ncbi:MAG: hypothetical protein AMXMBFR13_43320 [Phycisphaerae bacterium]